MDGHGPNYMQPIPCKNKEVYSELNTLIYEYLEVNGLEKSLSTFTKECLLKNLPCPRLQASCPGGPVKAAFTHYDGDYLLKSFDEGDLETFLKIWKQFQNHIQVTSEDMKKLEVYIRVHFAIYPKAHNQSESKQSHAMQLLKTFFEDNSASLSSDATILPLFALPFVADPRPHPVFKDLFHDNWTSKLRAQLETTVNKYFELLQENIQNHCKLASIVAKGKKAAAEQLVAAHHAALNQEATPRQLSANSNTSPHHVKSTVTRRPSYTKSITTSTSTASNSGLQTTFMSARHNSTVATSVSEIGFNQQAGSNVLAAAVGEQEMQIPQSIWKVTEAAILYHQERFFQLLAIHRKGKEVLRGVRENYSKLLKVSSILITALERSLASGTAVASSSQHHHPQPSSNLDLVLHQCLLIYPEIFTNPSSTNIASASPTKQLTPAPSKPDLAHFKQLALASSNSITSVPSQTAVAPNAIVDTADVSLLFLGLPDISLDTLNYTKIKENLISENLPCTEGLCLLQSLRWLITKTPASLRNFVMDSFIQNDLLGLSEEPEVSEKLFACLLSPSPTYKKESVARLVNAFASTCIGRTYLTTTNFMISTLVASLATYKTQEESFICHMVIATLQKLSLRRDMRRFMIDHQVIPWLVSHVKTELERDQTRSEVSHVIHTKSKDSNTANNNNNSNNSNVQETSYGDTCFNTYLMEYAWALLMNLCLHPESIKSALTVDFEFLQCIVTMLTSKASFEYTPYVLSTLFSLLRNPELFDKARTMELDKKLKPVIHYQPPDIQRHLKHLLTQLYETENVDRMTASGETDYDDTDNPDPEKMEPELELQESWMVNGGGQTEGLLTGDDLLIREYILPREMPLMTYTPPTKQQLQLQQQQQGSNPSTISGVGGGAVGCGNTTTNPTTTTQNQSMESYNSDSEKSASESPPSNPQPGLILRPTTPTHFTSTTDSQATGKFSLHESPMVSFKNSTFLNNNDTNYDLK